MPKLSLIIMGLKTVATFHFLPLFRVTIRLLVPVEIASTVVVIL